jgi:hypothetical protein
MKLADFIDFAKDEILADAVAKALEAISADLRTAQSRTESIDKSHGLAPATAIDQASAAETHGLLRARSGLQIEQVFAEYRALRSSVLRLLSEAAPPGREAVRDVGRFNEAIDQALAESVRAMGLPPSRPGVNSLCNTSQHRPSIPTSHSEPALPMQRGPRTGPSAFAHRRANPPPCRRIRADLHRRQHGALSVRTSPGKGPTSRLPPSTRGGIALLG